jgi:hypothetical protein
MLWNNERWIANHNTKLLGSMRTLKTEKLSHVILAQSETTSASPVRHIAGVHIRSCIGGCIMMQWFLLLQLSLIDIYREACAFF